MSSGPSELISEETKYIALYTGPRVISTEPLITFYDFISVVLNRLYQKLILYFLIFSYSQNKNIVCGGLVAVDLFNPFCIVELWPKF